MTRQTDWQHSVRWLPVGRLEIAPAAQRKFNEREAAEKAARFQLAALGVPVVSNRDGRYFLVDGQHRISAGKIAGALNSDTSKVECLVFRGLSEAQEAELFLMLNDSKKPGSFDSFRVALTAGSTARPEEAAIARAVHAEGLNVSRSRGEGSIAAISALQFVYRLGGEETLRCALRILRDSYSDRSAFESCLLKGMGLVAQRYNSKLNEEKAVAQLGPLTGGTIALQRRANALKLQTGRDKPTCMAAAIVETLNRAPGHKLESWWR